MNEKMKLTNKYNLPEPFVLAVAQDDYDNEGSWRSVTELIAPPKIAHLRRLHEDEIEEDAVDRVYTFQGSIVHAVVEKAAKKLAERGWLSEQRLFKMVDGRKISGAFDLFNPNTGELIDVKNSTVWKAKNGKAPDEWVNQINLLALLLTEAGHVVRSASIVLVIRDHSKPEARRDPQYPQAPVLALHIPLWGRCATEKYLKERVSLHVKAETEEIECTPEDRWAKPSIWAIRKKGSDRAIPGGLYAIESVAREKLAALGSAYEIDYRPGLNTRCELYCPAKPWCLQYKRFIK